MRLCGVETGNEAMCVNSEWVNRVVCLNSCQSYSPAGPNGTSNTIEQALWQETSCELGSLSILCSHQWRVQT